MRTFLFLLLLTFVYSYAGDFICFTAFHGRDIRDTGDFIRLAGEREKRCPGRPETPSQCGRVESPAFNAWHFGTLKHIKYHVSTKAVCCPTFSTEVNRIYIMSIACYKTTPLWMVPHHLFVIHDMITIALVTFVSTREINFQIHF